ncbi:MAG: Hsp20/alpha crystallin family protein [Desulfobaccales bacterium]
MAEKELQAKAKAEAPAKGERVRPGRVFLPAVDIFETPEALVMVADMPGVAADKVTVDLRDNHLVISGEVAAPLGQGETMVDQEYFTGDFIREFHLGSLIDQAKIKAIMKDGVLRLTLAKAARAKPRKIAVKAA